MQEMKLRPKALENLAVMICGNKDDPYGIPFSYRSSSYLTGFFSECDLTFVHDGSTRKRWVLDVLNSLNQNVASMPDLPSDDLVRVITELMDPDHFDAEDTDRGQALNKLNQTLSRDSLIAYIENNGQCYLRHTGAGTTSAMLPQRPRPLSPEEKQQRDTLSKFLDNASEDEFTETVLVPLFQRLGYHRVIASGHKEKVLEFGKDLWMKFQLPTAHWIYFAIQVKRVKIDAKGKSSGNVTEVLNQVRMALDHEIFDPDVNRTVLPDHIYVISAAEITRAAQAWIIRHLDREQRRQIIFMDRTELLNFAARIVTELPTPNSIDDEIPF